MASLAKLIDNDNVNVKTLSTPNSSTSILSRLHLLSHGLKRALPKFIAKKRKQATAISSNSNATKFSVTNCLPLRCTRFRFKAPEPDHTVDNGSLPTTVESDLGHLQDSLKAELLSEPSKSDVTREDNEEVLASKWPNVAEDLILKAGKKVLEEGSKGQRYLWNIARQHFINRKFKNTILMDIHNKYQIVRSVGEDCCEENELKTLIAKTPEPICFKRFQPSGLMNIAEGVMEVMNVNKLTNAGCRVKILIADQLAHMNKKLGGDIEKIETAGRYMIEVWEAMGMNLEVGKVEILRSTNEVGSRLNEYSDLVLDITDKTSLARLKRCWKIMDSTDEVVYLDMSQISTIGMQCADIFFLQADICQFGMDKREVNILAREYCDEIRRKSRPIVLSHHILPGLREGQVKMSKKILDSAIFMSDNEAEVNRKIIEAFCPEKVVEENPCLEYIKYLIFPWFNGFDVEQTEHVGRLRTFKSFEDLLVHYKYGIVQPDELKVALSKAINKILQPVRNHFKDDATAKQLLQSVLSYKVSG